MKQKIVILDYGSGNVKSVANSLDYLNINFSISNNDADLDNSTHIILPGVGSYGVSMEKIKKKINLENLKKQVLENKKPFLGICVGMQVLSSIGLEFKQTNGLGFIDGKTIKLDTNKLPIIHTGWNQIDIIEKDKLLIDIKNKSTFYFVHSYKFVPNKKNYILAKTIYNEVFCSIIKKKNIYGVQFHPEKSQTNGLRLINNFTNI